MSTCRDASSSSAKHSSENKMSDGIFLFGIFHPTCISFKMCFSFFTTKLFFKKTYHFDKIPLLSPNKLEKNADTRRINWFFRYCLHYLRIHKSSVWKKNGVRLIGSVRRQSRWMYVSGSQTYINSNYTTTTTTARTRNCQTCSNSSVV